MRLFPIAPERDGSAAMLLFFVHDPCRKTGAHPASSAGQAFSGIMH